MHICMVTPLEPTNVQSLMVFCEYFAIGTDSTRRPGMPRGSIQGFLSECQVAEKVMSFYFSNEKYPSCLGYIYRGLYYTVKWGL